MVANALQDRRGVEMPRNLAIVAGVVAIICLVVGSPLAALDALGRTPPESSIRCRFIRFASSFLFRRVSASSMAMVVSCCDMFV